MIQHPCFSCDAWEVCETELDLSVLAHSESILALSNGHIGLRANLEEGEPHGLPGTYLNSFYETRPLPYAEAGYGYPEAGQVVVNVTNGKIIRLLVDDEPFDVRYGELRAHRRLLDMRAGVLRREAEWVSPAGQAIRLNSVRLVSFVHRAVAAIRYEVEPLDEAARLVVQSELVANEPLPAAVQDDPRAGTGVGSALVSEEFDEDDQRVVLVHRTTRAACEWRRAWTMSSTDRRAPRPRPRSRADLGRVTVATEVEPGQRLCLVKFLAYGWSSQRSLPSVRDQVEAALASARRSGWDGLVDGQRSYLDEFWEHADVELEGDVELQQAVRFALFHTLQAGARAEQRAIAAKGLTGSGYDGHTFWDTENFVLPVLTYTAPRAARDALRWRHSTLDLAEGARRSARPRGRGLSVAHDPRAGVLGLLAGGDRRLPHQRRHRRRGDPLRRRDGRRGLRARLRARAAGRDRTHVALARPPRRAWAVPHRRGHRSRRVQRDRRQQHLYEPDGRAEPARRRRRGRALSGSRPRARHRRRGGGGLAGCRQGDAGPVRRGARSPPAGRGVHRARGLGLRPTPSRTSTRCSCTSPTSTSTESRW